jgi:hypothetical protein
LERFGFDGNAASVGKVARSIGIGNGTVILYTTRVIEALLSVVNDFISWPSKRQKKETTYHNMQDQTSLEYILS